jgi:hypothetical protein
MHTQAECIVHAIEGGFQRIIETINHLYSREAYRRDFQRTIDRIDNA